MASRHGSNHRRVSHGWVWVYGVVTVLRLKEERRGMGQGEGTGEVSAPPRYIGTK